MNIFGKTISTLEQGLGYSATKGKVISQNIANVDTPNYKAKNVSFEDVFSEMKAARLNTYQTDSRHIDFKGSDSQSGIHSNTNFRYRHDGNGVDMDKEQANLASNQIYYNALIDRISGKFNTLQSVIKGGL